MSYSMTVFLVASSTLKVANWSHSSSSSGNFPEAWHLKKVRGKVGILVAGSCHIERRVKHTLNQGPIQNSHSLLQEVDGAAARLVEEGGEPELVPDGGVGAEEDLLVGGVERAEVVLAARDVVGDDAVEAVEAAVALVVHLAAEVDGRRQVADEGVVPVAEHLREEKCYFCLVEQGGIQCTALPVH